MVCRADRGLGFADARVEHAASSVEKIGHIPDAEGVGSILERSRQRLGAEWRGRFSSPS